MNAFRLAARRLSWAGLSAAAILLVAGCTGMSMGQGTKVTLSGSEEVPPVMTSGSGTGTITVGEDGSVSGSVTTSGVNGVAAHIHLGARGKNGPVIVPLAKTGDSIWSVPAGAKLSPAQYSAYKAGDLYVNVHSPTHKGGEVRGQLMP